MNGHCENMLNNYKCLCGEGAKKMNETIPQSTCLIDYCYNIDCGWGKCEASFTDYSCECDSVDGFYHKYEWEPCLDIDECSTEVISSEPEFCQDGVCSNNIGGYDCTCPSGFEIHDNGPNKVPFCGNIQYFKNDK